MVYELALGTAERPLYFAGEKLYRSDTRGDAWTAISRSLAPASLMTLVN